MSIKDELKIMLPDELEKIKLFLDELLNNKVNSRITNHQYQIKNCNIKCNKCHSTNIVKNGHKNDTQRYKCKNCNNFFSITTNTVLSYTHISYETLIKYIECMVKGYSIQMTSYETKLSKAEVYTLRIKILSILNKYHNSVILKDIVEADEKYIRISFKGTRHDKMPRETRHCGSQKLISGISKEQMCIVVAIDSYDNIITEVAGNGPVTTDMLNKVLKGKIKENSILITDSKNSYVKFASQNKQLLKQIPHEKHSVDGIYNISELNSLINELDTWLEHFHGISTRHLQQYLNLFRFRKILKYTIEYLKYNIETYQFCVVQISYLRKKDIFKTEMPIDVEKIYGKPFK